MRVTRWRTRAADQDPRPESVGILRAVSASARAPADVGQDGRQAGSTSVSAVRLGLAAGVGAGLDHLSPCCGTRHPKAREALDQRGAGEGERMVIADPSRPKPPPSQPPRPPPPPPSGGRRGA